MAHEQIGAGPVSLVAGADLSGTATYPGKFRFVMAHTTAGQVVLCTSGSPPVGVAQDNAASGAAIPVQTDHISKVLVGGTALTAGVKVMSNGVGAAQAWVSGASIGGITLSGGSANGLVTVRLATFGGTA